MREEILALVGVGVIEEGEFTIDDYAGWVGISKQGARYRLRRAEEEGKVTSRLCFCPMRRAQVRAYRKALV